MAWPLDAVFKFFGYARYNSITPSLSNGDSSELQCDAEGRLLVNGQVGTTSWSDAATFGAERVVKSAAGKFYQIMGTNNGASTRYVFVFNATARPSNGATGEMFIPIAVPAGQSFSLNVDRDRARAFSTGLYWGISSTLTTFTYDAAASFGIAAEYV